MDPITLILTALTAGAASGLQDTLRYSKLSSLKLLTCDDACERPGFE
jgi:hypothetical protein